MVIATNDHVALMLKLLMASALVRNALQTPLQMKYVVAMESAMAIFVSALLDTQGIPANSQHISELYLIEGLLFISLFSIV